MQGSTALHSTKNNCSQVSCKDCATLFSITTWDQSFYQKMEVPLPRLCPECRQKRRTLQVNQIHLFKRKCDGTGLSIISNYPPDSPYKVYSQRYWYSDQYDGTTYGREFDFGRSFFEQFQELSLVVPRPALFTDYLRDENCEYTNYAGKNKNCYLIFDSDENWDCYYSFGLNHSRNTLECYRSQSLELCCETIDSTNCYNCIFVSNSESCSDSFFLNNCIGCKRCIMCSNLHQKEYHFLNKPISKERYDELRKSFGSYEQLTKAIADFDLFKQGFPQKYLHGVQNENVSGNHLVHCKNAHFCFDSMNLWDAKYCTQTFIKAKNIMDCHECGDSELLYECNNLGYNAYNVRFSEQCLSQITNLTYCNLCFNGCADLFGCVGLKRKTHCVLNKEYSPAEYSALVKKIIAHMKQTEEWGEYFPPFTTSFPYNLTVAQEHFPLTKEEAIKLRYQWNDPDVREYLPPTALFPDSISVAKESIINELFSCIKCERNFKVIPQELNFYKQAELALPRKCFFCRHQERTSRRNPNHLWKRNCDKCATTLLTSYAPRRKEQVFCETCYVNSLL